MIMYLGVYDYVLFFFYTRMCLPAHVIQVPGVNVPQQQLLPYFLALFVSGVFHEMGHAIAAVR